MSDDAYIPHQASASIRRHTMPNCKIEHCLGHEPLYMETDGEGTTGGMIFSKNPRPLSKGHESLQIVGTNDGMVTIKTEFGNASAAVVMPLAEVRDLLDRFSNEVEGVHHG